MDEIKGIARAKIRPGKLDEYKRLCAEAMEIVRTQDTGTLQYEIFFNEDESEAITYERYRDIDAALEHFGRIGHLPLGNVPYPLYVVSALVPWQFFSRVVSESTNSLITDQRLITRVYFPLLVVPIATALTAFVDFSLAMCLVFLLMICFGIIPGAAIFLFPVAVLLMLTAALGVGFWLSALNVEYRDVMHAIPFLVHFWFFITPVMYATSSIPGSWRWLVAFNPMTAVVEAFRWCLLGVAATDTQIAVVSGTTAIVFFLTGMSWFKRRERLFVDALGSGGA